MDRIVKALESFAVSYAFVIIIYVLISSFGVFSPIDNERAVQLMCICLVIAAVHFVMGFFAAKSGAGFYLICFLEVVAVVVFMGVAVYDFFVMDFTFIACLAVMLIIVFAATYLVAYFDDWKKIREINEIIRQNKSK